MNLTTALPNAKIMLMLEPEDLAGVILEIVQHGLASKTLRVGSGAQFNIPSLITPIQNRRNDPNWPVELFTELEQVLAEALAWLQSQVLIIRYKDTSLYALTRRGRTLRTRADLEAYREANILPPALIHARIAAKVVPLFVRGDHEIAVVQAFIKVEVAVRDTAGYGPGEHGVVMMRNAFHPGQGPLANRELVMAEREAEAALFAGAIGPPRTLDHIGTCR